jgi:hypothetical protein
MQVPRRVSAKSATALRRQQAPGTRQRTTSGWLGHQQEADSFGRAHGERVRQVLGSEGARPGRGSGHQTVDPRFMRSGAVPAAALSFPPPSEPPSAEQMSALAEEYGLEILGPPGIPA